jgi:hypothetical protein
MKVIYHSALRSMELEPGGILRIVPSKSYIELQSEKGDDHFDVVFNGTLIESGYESLKCDGEAELVIRYNEKRDVYTICNLVQPLSMKYARAYEQFSFENHNKKYDEIRSIQLGEVKLYAVDQSAEVYDWTDTFKQIEDAFSSFKAICERPKSHLKAVNEVRPIETVKRIGYESIPYLAAHSEDWLARTASGLKPARLFSRVEDDEYQIYENRVVKTLVDLIISFLRKTEKQLRDQRDQLQGIMNSGVQTGSFGFDISFQKAVSELMSADSHGDEYRSKNLELVKKLQLKSYLLLKKYRTLRRSKLYRYLRKSKTVSNPLNETNILVMDRHYKVVLSLWKTIHRVIVPKAIEEEGQIEFCDICDYYQEFCAMLCGYAAHVLGFEYVEAGTYKREADQIQMNVMSTDEDTVRVRLSDTSYRALSVENGVDIPISAGESRYGFRFDGRILAWRNDITEEDIENFCSIFKTRESRGREKSEEKRKYAALKQIIDDQQRRYPKPKANSFLIVPAAVEIGTDNRNTFKASMDALVSELRSGHPDEAFIIALPACNENEQKIIDYAREDGQQVAILLLTMFDINSFRRIQNVLYRHILQLDKGTCPNCGGKMREHDNQAVCDVCGQLTVTRTICPNPECKHEYSYIGYDVADDTIQRMQEVSQENFFQWDSLYQYKNIVNMIVKTGKIRTICPHCHQ